MDPEFASLEAEFMGFLGDGAIAEIEDLMPDMPSKVEIDDGDRLLSLTWAEFMGHMASGFYISETGSIRAVEDGVMAFATFPKKPSSLDKKYLAKAGLAAVNTLVPAASPDTADLRSTLLPFLLQHLPK